MTSLYGDGHLDFTGRLAPHDPWWVWATEVPCTKCLSPATGNTCICELKKCLILIQGVKNKICEPVALSWWRLQAKNDFVSLKEMYMNTNIQILSREPTSRRRHTWFEPMGMFWQLGITTSCLTSHSELMVHAGCRPRARPIRPTARQIIASVSPKQLLLQQFGQSHWQCMPQRYICANLDEKYRTIDKLKG